MSGKSLDFSKMVVYDFSTITASSTNNCFGCDACDAACDYDPLRDGNCDCDCNSSWFNEPEQNKPIVEIINKLTQSKKRLVGNLVPVKVH